MTANNQIILIGRVGQGPEVKYTKSGMAACQVNLAVNRTTKDAMGNPITDWISVQLWDKRAENFAKYVNKGDLISVTGSLQIDNWEKDGEKRSKARVNVEGFQMLGSKGDKATSDPQTSEVKQAASKTAQSINRSQNRDQAIDNALAGDEFVDDDELPPF